jgi:hypothetical protein
MANYIAYDKEICVPWFNQDSYLFDCVQEYKLVLEEQGIVDKYAQKARMCVFYNIVCKDNTLLTYYCQLMTNKYYIPDRELVDQLDEMIRTYSWKRIFMALRFVVKRYIKLEYRDSVNGRRLDKSLDKLREVPFLTIVPPKR